MDLQGATVLPGLHDCHAHLTITGFDAQGIGMYDAKDIPEVLRRLQEADPMAVDPRTIKDIRVLGTVRKGDLIYRNF